MDIWDCRYLYFTDLLYLNKKLLNSLLLLYKFAYLNVLHKHCNNLQFNEQHTCLDDNCGNHICVFCVVFITILGFVT